MAKDNSALMKKDSLASPSDCIGRSASEVKRGGSIGGPLPLSERCVMISHQTDEALSLVYHNLDAGTLWHRMLAGEAF